MASHETFSALFACAPSLATDAAHPDDDCFHLLDQDDHCLDEFSPMSPNSHELSSSHSSDVEDEEDDEGGITQSALRARVSGLSIDGGPDDERGFDGSASPVASGCRRRRRRAGTSSLSGRLVSRERWVDKAWEARSGSASPDADSGGCQLLLRTRGGRSMGRIRMDMEEVQACRDLGLELPGDCMVEICGSPTAPGASGSAPCSGGSSPRGGGGSWICSPGDDPREIKARLKLWAHAVALASASRLSC